MVIHAVVTYSAETWVVSKSDENTLLTFKRKMLRNIFRPVREDNQWRIRMNIELEKLYRDVNIGTFIKLQRLTWLGHLQ
jgi:hypothetical protein